MDEFGLSGFDITAIVIAALFVFLIFAGVKTVPQGYNYTVERFQKYTRTLYPGLTLIVPFIDQIGRKMNVMEQVLEIPRQDVISRDNAIVQVDGVAFFQVVDAAQASYEVTNLERAILALTMTNIRSVLGSMDLDHMLSQRDEINSRLLHVVDAAAGPWGVKVTRIEIKDITPPSDIVTAMGRQMKAEREKRAAVLVAEGAKQAQILEAEGRKEAAFRDAEARERSAQAEATATTMVSEAVARGDMAALNYFIAQKYVEALKAMATSPNQKTMVLPYEATALLGALGGVAEIARDSFGGASAATAAARATAPAARPAAPRSSVPPSGVVTTGAPPTPPGGAA
ncbi:SPFH domain-containing protein [Hansschlegelia zhihuaiae]|uniref:SPFH/Band 7/PHB domain protein n=1 Tax=Hansschlegelia zhihuaiae TaxID=405005 RepID=A0A4Q0MJ93_9HYPH|nr:SPFH domain-containing protein [Hansschlegelia zhihuaiae]RXF73453.1 SPFH/Band 7/PHB domain protein [Hansschlegelia zhihuaiae]